MSHQQMVDYTQQLEQQQINYKKSLTKFAKIAFQTNFNGFFII
jgi:hypothetical protein